MQRVARSVGVNYATVTLVVNFAHAAGSSTPLAVCVDVGLDRVTNVCPSIRLSHSLGLEGATCFNMSDAFAQFGVIFGLPPALNEVIAELIIIAETDLLPVGHGLFGPR